MEKGPSTPAGPVAKKCPFISNILLVPFSAPNAVSLNPQQPRLMPQAVLADCIGDQCMLWDGTSGTCAIRGLCSTSKVRQPG